ncbi:MAG: transposase [Treponema sp.]|nr:transposase [Candidatus Treponema caballi]
MLRESVAEVLNDIWIEKPFVFLQTDNGPEFRSSTVQNWCKAHAVKQVFSRPGKPTDNCFIESFNRVFRDECLNENYFTSLSEAKKIINFWRCDYNENRPQKGLKKLTPSQFKSKLEYMKNSP